MFPAPDYDMDTDTTEPQRRLPRSFVDDPFFSNSDVFRDFPRDIRDFPSRRFGSNPRIFDDDPNSFFGEFEPRSSFHSLPRRANSRSPGPQGHGGQQQNGQGQHQQSQTERPIPVHRQYPTERSPSRHGSQTIPVKVQRSGEESPKRAPFQRASPPKEFQEINNSQNTSSYTNGELNPDRKAQKEQSPPAPIPTITVNSPVDSPPEKKFIVKEESIEKVEEKKPEKEETMAQENEPMPPTRRLGRGFSLDGCSDKLLDLLDEAERRVEALRDTAAQMEQEKEQLLDMLNNVRLNADILRLNQGERDDLLINADRILNRCKAVDVAVTTPRNEHQAKALDEVNFLLQAVINKMKEDLNNSKETVKMYLNACSPDEVGPIDQKFQAKIIECTADDQKKIRRKLAQIISQIERAEKVVPEH